MAESIPHLSRLIRRGALLPAVARFVSGAARRRPCPAAHIPNFYLLSVFSFHLLSAFLFFCYGRRRKNPSFSSVDSVWWWIACSLLKGSQYRRHHIRLPEARWGSCMTLPESLQAIIWKPDSNVSNTNTLRSIDPTAFIGRRAVIDPSDWRSDGSGLYCCHGHLDSRCRNLVILTSLSRSASNTILIFSLMFNLVHFKSQLCNNFYTCKPNLQQI